METTMGAVRHPGTDLSYEQRDACLHALGALHAAGKLSLAELDARIEAALAARTDEELAALVHEDSRIDVPPRAPAQPEPRPEVARQARRTGGSLFALRVVAFAALMLLAGVVRVLALTAVALIVGVARVLVVTARLGSLAYQALARRTSTWGTALDRSQANARPIRLQSQRSVSQELVLVPKPGLPAQRQPVKVHPVLVPNAAGSPSTELVLARRSDVAVRAERSTIRGKVLSRDLASLGQAFPREDRRLRELVSQLQPLVQRVRYRARWRRSTSNACERAAHTNGWRRAISGSRTAV